MPALYDIALGGYHMGVRVVAPFNTKARAWVEGRRGLWERLGAKREALRGCLWMHCASVGEFEQGRPVLERLKAERPELPVLLTFFSPSGYEARKNYPGATHVEYLPADGAANARRLADLLQPRAAIFIKYEFWYHHLHALKAKGVPTFLVSGIFREGQPFFKWYGGAWRNMLGCYDHLFVQDERSSELLMGLGVKNVSVSGDTRFDRVMEIVQANEELPAAKAFKEAAHDAVLVCGSTWPQDEALITEVWTKLPTKPRILVAPHELNAASIASAERLFPKPLITWSEAVEVTAPSGFHIPTLLVDRMGLLARLYKYGDVAYVGGGFGDGIHSLLEAAAWGRPVIFGPKHTKFAEAQGLIDAGGGWCIHNAGELRGVLERLLGDPAALRSASEAAGRYVRERTGATERVLSGLRAAIR